MDGGAIHTPWPSTFPELATERLRLRSPVPDDASALLDILRDPEVTKYHSMPTLTTLAEAQAVLERLQQRYAARDAIRWAIELVEHGEMIGTAGLHRFDFEHRRAEVGYEIARWLWGRGLMPEAVAAVIQPRPVTPALPARATRRARRGLSPTLIVSLFDESRTSPTKI
jgi:RimJ/RimL family protein N-acetyltransferase